MHARAEPTGGTGGRARVDGKFLQVDGRRFFVKGVAYGTFAPDRDGSQFPSPERVEQDFAAMAAAGINTVRTYTPPTLPLLDAAARHGLRLMAGLAWPQHVPFLDDKRSARAIRREAAQTVGGLADHPGSLLFAVGNEIPPGIVRWHGPARIERFLRELYEDVKAAAPESLLAYVNFPPTEHLDLEVFDVAAYNVYLHREPDLRAYLARLQHIAGTRPLLLAEAGGDSIREGRDGQASITATHLSAAFAEGACGAVAYSWTDEWWRGGTSVDDWAFGLVDEERRPKPALAAVREAFAEVPFPAERRSEWPKVSVVVCAYNAAPTIDDCLASLSRLTYPDYEVIVVDDGSHDETGDLARRFEGVRVIAVPNGGLSAARNVGLAAATGEIVAYTDADVRVDESWLDYLVQPLLTSDAVGVGGPNVVPADDPWVAQCVARSPGGPVHVMLDDRTAEHVPGCNMAFWRESLLAVDGFNPVYVRAGDDVDICWRLQERRQRIGFAPSALVWHHHRTSLGAYWRQQVGYGEAEARLDAHHPEKFLGGNMVWRGRIYSPLPFLRTGARRVNTGVWGTAAFPSVYSPQVDGLRYLPHTPAWMAVSLVLFLIGIFGPLAGMDAAWLPLIVGFLGGAVTLWRCLRCGWRSDLSGLPPLGRHSMAWSRFRYRGLIAWLHLLQPLARFRGRLLGLATPHAVEPQHMTRHPWKAPVPKLGDALDAVRLVVGSGSERRFWSESWVSPTKLLTELVGVLRAARPPRTVDVDDGWDDDRDLSLAVGRWGWLHVQTLMEEHEHGASLLRTRTRFRPSPMGTLRGASLAFLVAMGTSASMFRYDTSLTLLVAAVGVAGIAAWTAWEAVRAAVVVDRAIDRVTAAAGMMCLRGGASRRAAETGGSAPQAGDADGSGETVPDAPDDGAARPEPLGVPPRWPSEHPAARVQRQGASQ